MCVFFSNRVSVQALELRESCVCPALPATDPRAVFSRSVQVLLQNAKDQERAGPQGANKRSAPSLPAPLPAALLPHTPAPAPAEAVTPQDGVQIAS